LAHSTVETALFARTSSAAAVAVAVETRLEILGAALALAVSEVVGLCLLAVRLGLLA
jgi:hypothetical protein